MRTSSAKAKGRRLQDFIRDTFRYIFKEQLEPDDIKCAIMGTSGTDIVLSPAAKKLIPFDIESKNQENVSIPAALRQASANAKPGRVPLVVFKKNHGKVYVALEYDAFMKLIYKADIQQITEAIKKQEAELKPDVTVEPPKYDVFKEGV